MPRKEFAAFTRLDASDVNTYLMDQAVQTFAGTAARGSAITTPVEGMVTYLEDLNRYDTYNGSSFVPAFGLTHIETITFSGAASASFSNNVFTTDYSTYFLYIELTSRGASTILSMRFRANGSDDTATSYNFLCRQTGMSTGAETVAFSASASSINLESVASTSGINFYTGFIVNPKESQITTGNLFGNRNVANSSSIENHFTFNATTSFDSLSLINSAAVNIGGQAKLYGVKK